MEKPKYPVQTVIKAIEIIEILAKDATSKGIGISDLSRRLGLGKSTIHRILETLMYYKYIDKNEETNKYRLGWGLYTAGQMVPKQNQLYNMDPPLLIDLSKIVRETVNVGIMRANEVVIISKIEGSQENLQVNMQQGEHEALHATGLGKILLCELPEDQIREMLDSDRGRLKKFTHNTIDTVEEYLDELEKVRKQGYAVDNEEFCVGLYCLARPLRDYTGKIIAALSVSTPYARITEAKIQEILGYLAEYSVRISGNLGYQTEQ